jgi:hypothetical protein
MNLLDLPDEMLVSIFNEFTAVDALSTFIGLHPRLDRIVCDPMLVRHLDFTGTTWNGETICISDQVIDRVCGTILPRISEHINELTLNPPAMERVLTPLIVYRTLSSLSLLDFPLKSIVQHLTGKITIVISMNGHVPLL